jgi:hypothetical protein
VRLLNYFKAKVAVGLKSLRVVDIGVPLMLQAGASMESPATRLLSTQRNRSRFTINRAH